MLDWITTKYVRCHELQHGQTMTEYVMVLVAIAIAVFVAYQRFGTTVSLDVTTIASDL